MTGYHVTMTGSQTVIYRSALPDRVGSDVERTGSVVRPPLYVPSVVDNLWEWRRPVGYPSRRMSAFASPTPELARQEGPPGAKVYQVDISSGIKAGQLCGYSDSSNHPEAVALPIFLYERLGSDWIGARIEEKTRPAVCGCRALLGQKLANSSLMLASYALSAMSWRPRSGTGTTFSFSTQPTPSSTLRERSSLKLRMATGCVLWSSRDETRVSAMACRSAGRNDDSNGDSQG